MPNHDLQTARTNRLAQLRAAMPQQAGAHFHHGAARTAFETIWTPARYRALTAFLADAPVSWRHFLKTQVFRAVEQAGEEADMTQIFSALRLRFPALAGE